MRGLIIGRFQPFHCGHRFVIERVAADFEELFVAIGSADRSHTVRNPFTGGERMRMVSGALSSVDASACTVLVRDIDRNALWARHVVSRCPRFDAVCTNNPLVGRLFEEQGFETRETPLYDREQYRGTEIRRRMVEDEEWSTLVPDPVRNVVDEIEGVDRLKRVSVQTDFPPADG